MSARLLDREFYARGALEVAPGLLGCVLVVGRRDKRIELRINETEAYTADDPASHSFRGATDRNRVMFGPPGHMYTYFTYGMHWCANVVTGGVGNGEAVLLRGGIVEKGLELVSKRRRTTGVSWVRDRDLTNGPAKLTQALALDGAHNGIDVCSSRSYPRIVSDATPMSVEATPRIGISVATERLWRFVGQTTEPRSM